MKKNVSVFVIEGICCVLIMLFVYAAISKLRDIEQFRIQLGQSPLLTRFPNVLSLSVPGSELVIAAFMAVPRLRLFGLYGSFALMASFTFYIIAILQLDSNIPCSCGGILESMGWTEHLIFNALFSLIALTGVLIFPMRREPEIIQRIEPLPAGS